MHNTWPVFWHPSSNADLRKYGFVRQGLAPIKQVKMQVTRYKENGISLQNRQQTKASFYFILFKDSIFSREKTQFLCMKPSFRNDMLAS